jgi:hypothetical protein
MKEKLGYFHLLFAWMLARSQYPSGSSWGLPYRHSFREILFILWYYAAYSGNSVPTFRDKLSFPYSRVKKSKKTSWHLKMGPIACPETSVQIYHSTLRNTKEERGYHLRQSGNLKSSIVFCGFSVSSSKYRDGSQIPSCVACFSCILLNFILSQSIPNICCLQMFQFSIRQ